MRRLLLFPGLLLIALAAPTAALAAGGQTVSGTVTVTGTAGKDEFLVRIANPAAPEFTVTPAATVTSTNGACTADNDLATGRPVRNRCAAGSINSLILNLQGGDDNVTVTDEVGNVLTATANSGPGNDVVTVSIRGARTMNGEAGDDHLRIPGMQTAGVTTFDGGVGTDLAAYGTVNTTTNVPVSIAGSLQTNQVVLKRHEPSFQLTTLRTDTLTGIEGLEGTALGDVITGGPSDFASQVIGGEGPDNLTGGTGGGLVSGGPGLDNVTGGGGITIDGGTGIDVYRGGRGDTFLMRDGYAETADCLGSNTVINDLADTVTSSANCSSIQTAAAKHKHDTTISTRRLKIAPNGATLVRLKCPLRKREPCVGKLTLRKGKTVLGTRTYRLAQGTAKLLRFRLTRRAARRAAGAKVDIVGEETDDDARPRLTMRRVPARRRPA